MKNWKIKIIFIAIILILFAVILVSLSKNLSSYKDIKDKYTFHTHYLNNLPYFKTQLARMEKEIEEAPKKINSNLTSIKLLNHCSKFANELKISILSYNPINKPGKSSKEFKKISIEINIKTDFIKMIKFINKIETLNFMTSIDKLEVFRIEPYSSDIKSKIIITGFTLNEK